jgi:hypothetical protein
MRWRTRVPLLAACLAASACIVGFTHPLGPASESFIAPELLGTWACTTAGDPTPALITFLDFDGRQYAMTFVEEGKDEPSQARALGTHLEDASYLSMRELGSDSTEWTLLEYQLLDESHLRFRIVDAHEFEDVLEDAASVRQRLAERRQDPDVFAGEIACARKSSRAAGR